MQLHRRVVKAERLDGLEQDDLVAMDREARRGDRLADVARRHRSVELAGLASLADDDEAEAVKLLGDDARFGLEFEIARLELAALAFEFLLVGFGGAQGLAMRQQKIAGETVLHAHCLAHLTELGDAFEQNDFHGSLLAG